MPKPLKRLPNLSLKRTTDKPTAEPCFGSLVADKKRPDNVGPFLCKEKNSYLFLASLRSLASAITTSATLAGQAA